MTNIMTVPEIKESKKKIIEAFRNMSILYSELDERFLAICMGAAFDSGIEFSDEDEEYFMNYMEHLDEGYTDSVERMADAMKLMSNSEVASVLKDIMKLQVKVFNEVLDEMN